MLVIAYIRELKNDPLPPFQGGYCFWHYLGLKPIGAKITISRIGRGDCPARPTRGIQPQDLTGAFSLAGPKSAVAICARLPLATELYRRGRLVAPLNFRSGFCALACRDSRR
jgi:hypothetical protein